MPPRPSHHATNVNTWLLAVLTALGGFIASQVYGLNAKAAVLETKITTIEAQQNGASMELTRIKEKLSTIRSF